MPDRPNASFIICTYNRAKYLKDSLHTLIKSTTGQPVEILVIDNNSTDHTHRVCLESAKISEDACISLHYVKESKQGLSYARNRGIKEANAPILIFIDDDINVPATFVKAWLTFFNDHPTIRAGGGKVRIQFDDPRPEWMSSYLLPLLAQQDYGDILKQYRKTDYPFGVNMAFREDIFDKYGTFNTSLGRIGSDLKASEEKEFFQRLHQNGVKIFYVPDAYLYHRVNSSRLTKDYIRRQAIGLGQSIKLQLKRTTLKQKFTPLAKETIKWCATAVLFIFYCLKLQASKGVALIQFRYWILQGLLSRNSSQ